MSHFRYHPLQNVVFHTPETWSSKANIPGNPGKPAPEDQTAAINSNFTPTALPGVMLTPTVKLPDGAMGEATPWPRQLQHPFLRGPHAWHLPKGLDFSLPSLCSQVLNINQWPSYLFPKGLISLFQQPSSTKCKELSAAQLMQSSPKSQQPCSMQIFGGY